MSDPLDHRDCLPGFCVFPAGDPQAERHGPSWQAPQYSSLCHEDDHGLCEGEINVETSVARPCECPCHVVEDPGEGSYQAPFGRPSVDSDGSVTGLEVLDASTSQWS